MSGKQSTPPWRSRLIPYQKEIMDAWFRKRATLKMIQKELADKDVTISLSTLSYFIRCRKKHPDSHEASKEKSSKPRKALSANPENLLDDLVTRSPEKIKQEWLNREQ